MASARGAGPPATSEIERQRSWQQPVRVGKVTRRRLAKAVSKAVWQATRSGQASPAGANARDERVCMDWMRGPTEMPTP